MCIKRQWLLVFWCVRRGPGSSRRWRMFGTWTQDLRRLAEWLNQQKVTHVAMEATGVYWKPVWAVLAGQFELLLVTACYNIVNLLVLYGIQNCRFFTEEFA
jgi:hypothetical protein